MTIEIKIPSPGESITEVEIANWLVNDGDYVEKDQEIAEIESDKATLPLIAEQSGALKIQKEAGQAASVGEVVGSINTDANAPEKPGTKPSEDEKQGQEADIDKTPDKGDKKNESQEQTKKHEETERGKVKTTPVARKLMEENNLSIDDVIKGLRRISKKEVEGVLNNKKLSHPEQESPIERNEDRKKMSQLRKKISKRLVSVKNETAMLTTFNEVDMTNVIALRKKYQEKFIEKHEVKLGFMSFFTKAAAQALELYPSVNSMIDGEEILTPNYQDIGIAVQTDKGLMVPVIRDVQGMSLAGIEKQIIDLAGRARKFRLSIDEMSGGTFTITNGGVFGSMLSTPIINPPQSGILGMHNIVERPVAMNGKVEIRPIMYVALSYDHRVIDGKDSVSFLVKIKELIENPHQLLGEGKALDELLLDI